MAGRSGRQHVEEGPEQAGQQQRGLPAPPPATVYACELAACSYRLLAYGRSPYYDSGFQRA